MLFSSHVFLFFYLPIVLLVYFLAPRPWRNGVLLLVSLAFYGWGEPVYLLLMVGVIAVNFACGLWMQHQRMQGIGIRWILMVGVAADLLILGFFKYGNFFLSPFAFHWKFPEISLPIGISFYIFQCMSYLIDVYRGDAPVQGNVLTFGTYVALFPQLIAGPIVRYRDVAQQLEHRTETISGFSSGVTLFLVGLSKKLLLANPMGMLWMTLQKEPGTLGGWIGICAYSLQIYFDFSGYSDMARGLGRLFGFEFLENFNYPYLSQSVTEFWRRWHISLSTWFREYVYIPLGGNRRGVPRQILNIFIVWTLTGLWHGASWNFVLWGMYYALLLIGEKVVFLKVLNGLPTFFRHVYTILAIMLGWVLFYFENFSTLLQFLSRLFVPCAATSHEITMVLAYLPLLIVAMVAATPAWKLRFFPAANPRSYGIAKICAVIAMLLLCTGALASQSYNPFIYFRF